MAEMNRKEFDEEMSSKGNMKERKSIEVSGEGIRCKETDNNVSSKEVGSKESITKKSFIALTAESVLSTELAKVEVEDGSSVIILEIDSRGTKKPSTASTETSANSTKASATAVKSSTASTVPSILSPKGNFKLDVRMLMMRERFKKMELLDDNESDSEKDDTTGTGLGLWLGLELEVWLELLSM
jgi:hypothetical protein